MRAGLLFLFLAACSSSTPPREPDEYIGCATDENWQTFDSVSDIVSDADAPLLTAPTGTLGKMPVDFTWQASPTIVGMPQGDVDMTCPQWNTGFSTLHEPPVSGTVYDVQLLVGGVIQHRALTTLQKWTASPDVWSGFAGKTITLKLRKMTLLQNDLKEGPFVATSTPTFSVSP